MDYKCNSTLFDFQRDTVERAKRFDGRCILALEMGAGKSICAATYILETKSFPAIVVCPASLKYNWAQEFGIHYNKRCIILSCADPNKFFQSNIDKSRDIQSVEDMRDVQDAIFIINYDILEKWVSVLLSLNPSVLVLDECQYVKTPQAKRTKACAELAYSVDKLLALSGTPMQSNPMELYPILNMIFKGRICSRWKFMNRYTQWNQTKFGIQIRGTKNETELNTFLNNECMIRYKTEDVLKDLPPFIRQTTLLEMTQSQKSEYRKLQDSFEEWMISKYPNRRVPRSEMAQILTQFGYMKRQVAEWKIPSIIETINNFLDGNDGKLIVFGIHKKMLDAIWSAFEKKNSKRGDLIVRLDGSTPQLARHNAVYEFQRNPKTRIFLGQLVAAGVGLTLTASNHSLFSEVDFVPSNHTQAEARNRRIGTEASFVHYNYVLMKDTIEELVCNKLFDKQQAIDRVIDGKSGTDSSFNLISTLLRSQIDRFDDSGFTF